MITHPIIAPGENTNACSELTFSAANFAESFGTTITEIDTHCGKTLRQHVWRYRPLLGRERDELIMEVLQRIERDRQIIGAPDRREVWERGWNENLREFVESNGRLSALLPKFVRRNHIVRLNQDYVKTTSPDFERDFVNVLRDWVFRHYFTPYDAIYEFGCGTGLNLVFLANIFPDKELIGSDFVPSACDLVNEIAKHLKLPVRGLLFDMIHPDNNFEIKPGSAVFTSGSIEQLAGKFEAFLQFLCRKKPSICVHIEPTAELYDETQLVDYLAILFQRKRGYTEGLLPRLRELHADGKIELIKQKRLYFGSLMIEGYNLLVWRPVAE